MADPFSILSAAAGLTDVAVRTSVKLRTLVDDFKNAPVLISGLSNEITEIRLVLERLDQSRQAVEGLGDAQHDASFLACLGAHLDHARAILADLESLAVLLGSSARPANQGFRWLRQKKHAMLLKNRLKAVREKMNELLVSHNPSLESRIKLELQEVKVGVQQAQTAIHTSNSGIQATSAELVNIRTTLAHQQTAMRSDVRAMQISVSAQAAEAARDRQEVDNQLAAIHSTIHAGSSAIDRFQSEQTRQFEAIQTVQMTILTELAALSNASAVSNRSRPRVSPAPSISGFEPVISFSMRLRGSRCVESCGCKCHLPARPGLSLQVPPMLRAAIGYLFLGYTGYPSAAARCDLDSCARGKYMRLQVTYSFPIRWCLHYVLHAFIEASTSGALTFALVARRRMPFEAGNVLYEAQVGNTKTMELMLRREKGCTQDVYNIDGRSALRLAINDLNPKSIEIVRLLLRTGADPDQDDDFGISPRLFASQVIVSGRYSPAYARALEDFFPLSSCIEAMELSYMHKIVLGLLPIALSIALRKPDAALLNARDRFGFTPLMYAASRGDVAAVSALLDSGAEVNAVDVTGQTALHRTVGTLAEEGNLVCVCPQQHSAATADVDAVAREGHPCPLLTAEMNQVLIGRKLIDAGANIHAPKRFSGSTPVWRAAFHKSAGMVRCLYEAGASLEPVNSNGETPLFAAVQSGATEVLVLLLRLGADTSHVDRKGRTLLHHVASVGNLKAMRSFAGVRVRGQHETARDADGFTAWGLLEKRQPTLDMRDAFMHVAVAWCRDDYNEGDEDNASDFEDCFYDAVEDLRCTVDESDEI